MDDTEVRLVPLVIANESSIRRLEERRRQLAEGRMENRAMAAALIRESELLCSRARAQCALIFDRNPRARLNQDW